VFSLSQFALPPCMDFVWDRASFLQRSSYDAVLWISDKTSIDNTLLFFLLLNIAGGGQEVGMGHSQDS